MGLLLVLVLLVINFAQWTVGGRQDEIVEGGEVSPQRLDGGVERGNGGGGPLSIHTRRLTGDGTRGPRPAGIQLMIPK